MEILQKIYQTTDTARYLSRIEALKQTFAQNFDENQEISVFSVAGRIEVAGNHTDHQLGKVLCASINLDTLAACSKREDTVIRLISEGYGETTLDVASTEYVKEEENSTIALIRGVCNKIKMLGYEIGGFNAYVTSDVLGGSGMSSSASFEGLIGNIINNFYCNSEIEQVELAKIGQYAENVYFGKLSGLMDQIACVLGGFVYINFYDNENPIIEKIDSTVISNDYDICIIDTGDSHGDLSDEYSNITREMRTVADFFGQKHLSRVDEDEFYKNIPEIRKITSDRAVTRAIHFFDDNRCVELQKNALKSGNIDEFLRLVTSSGQSSMANLQNIFSCAEPHIQGSTLVLSLCRRFLEGKGAYRIHGGGFGGTVQAFVPKDMTGEFKAKIENITGKDTCYVLSIRSIEATKI